MVMHTSAGSTCHVSCMHTLVFVPTSAVARKLRAGHRTEAVEGKHAATVLLC